MSTVEQMQQPRICGAFLTGRLVILEVPPIDDARATWFLSGRRNEGIRSRNILSRVGSSMYAVCMAFALLLHPNRLVSVAQDLEVGGCHLTSIIKFVRHNFRKQHAIYLGAHLTAVGAGIERRFLLDVA